MGKPDKTSTRLLLKPVYIQFRADDTLSKSNDQWQIKGRRRDITVRAHVSSSWLPEAKVIVDASALKGACEININHQFIDDEHTLVVEIVTDKCRKQSMLQLKDVDMLRVNIDPKAKIEFKAEINGIQFLVRPSRDERISFDEDKNALNFFNGFRKIHVDLHQKIHVELNADQIIDDITI